MLSTISAFLLFLLAFSFLFFPTVGEYPQLMAQLHERFKSTSKKPASSSSSSSRSSLMTTSSISSNNNSTSRESISPTSSVRGIGSVLGGGGGLGGLGGGLSGLGGGHRANKLAAPASAVPTNSLATAAGTAVSGGGRAETRAGSSSSSMGGPGAGKASGMRGSTVGVDRAIASSETSSSSSSSSPVAFYLSGDEHSIQVCVHILYILLWLLCIFLDLSTLIIGFS